MNKKHKDKNYSNFDAVTEIKMHILSIYQDFTANFN